MDSVAQENKICGDCLHYVGPTDRCDKTNGICYYGASACNCFERPYPSCGNCIHFLDGEEFGLCCDLQKGIVKKEYEEACENYERI